MWKLNSRKLDMIMQFDFIRIDVANFICTTFFEHNYLCIHLFSIPVNSFYFIFFLFLFLHPFRRSLYNVHIILWQFWQYVTSLYLLTYDDFEKHTHFFYAMLMYSRVWNKRSPLNKHSPLENLAKRIIVAPFFTLYYEVRNKAVAPGKKSKN